MDLNKAQRWPQLDRGFWLVCVGALACILPFVNKAYHIDDPVYLWVAEQIRAHPFDFFGFEKNWAWRIEPMYVINLNPPGISYYIAAVSLLFGWSEIAMHLAFLLPTLLSVAGVYVLAGRLSSRPALAAWLTILTPAFAVGMTTIMCEPAMLAFYVWALIAWIYGMDSGDRRAFIVAGLLIGVGSLMKFIVITAIPLLAAYTLARDRKWTRTPLYLFIALGIVAAYNLYTSALYEVEAFSSAASFSVTFTAQRSFDRFVDAGGRILSTLIYMGGCFASFAFIAPWLWGRRALTALVMMFALIAAFVFSSLFDPIERSMFNNAEPTAFRLLQTSFWAAAGLHLALLTAAAGWKRRDPESLLLVLLVLGMFVFSAFVNWTTNARSLLPMLPALAILAARWLDDRRPEALGDRWAVMPLAAAATLALAVSAADYETAGIARKAADDVAARVSNEQGNVIFSGQWGIRWYFEQYGFVGMAYAMEEDEFGHVNEGRIDARAGDVYVVHPYAGGFTHNFAFLDTHADALDELTYERSFPIATHDFAAGAGFYSAHVGPLPFVFGRVEPEIFEIYRVNRAVSQRYEFVRTPKGADR